MGKSSKKASKSSTLPLTPVIFINDPQLTAPNIRALAAVLPSATTIETGPADLASLKCFYRGPASRDLVVIAAQSYDDDNHDKKVDVAKSFKQETIQLGCNFVSVNLYLSLPTPADKLKEWGTNHLDLNIAMLSPQQTADKIYKWLFTVLSVPETLHIIHPDEMKAIDSKNFPQYEYCPLSESRIRPKDAKIQFVALITSKAQVTPAVKEGESARLTWTAVDRTGSATFYFLHRGPSSQPTWDWVLSMKPGDRRALPRMPSVLVSESLSIRILKSPFRLTGSVISGSGTVIKAVGYGVGKLGKKIALGKGREWVPEADVVWNGKGKAVRKGSGAGGAAAKTVGEAGKGEEKRNVKVFDDEGKKVWGEKWDLCDDDVSTEAGSLLDEKLVE